MVVKKFVYEDGMNLLVPAKCGTRWVDGNTMPKSIINAIHHKEIISVKNLVDSKTKMIFRNPHDALISGLHTEYVWFGYTIKELIDNFWDNKFNHCSFDFWEHIYELWDLQPFELIPQSDLSELFGFKKSDFNSSLYDSHLMENYISKDELKQKIGIVELKKMYDVIDVDAMWLERMIKNERGLVSYRRFNKIIFEYEKIMSDLTKQSEIINHNNIEINNLNNKITNNKKQILEAITILNNVILANKSLI